MPSRTSTREPRLFPATGSGLGILAVRDQQVWVDQDGVLRRGDEVLAAAGTLTGAVVVPDEREPLLGFLTTSGPAVSIALRPHSETVGATRDIDSLLAVSGAIALAGALELPVTSADPTVADGVRRLPTVRPTPPVTPGRHALRLAAALVLLLVGIIALAAVPAALPVLVLLACWLTAGPVLAMSRDRRRFLDAVTSLPDVPGSTTVAPSHPLADGRTTTAALLLSPDRWVAHHHGRETWLPGPRAGGVTHVVRTPELLLLEDAEHRSVGFLQSGWAVSAAFEEACARLGVSVRVSDQPGPRSSLGGLEAWWDGEGEGGRGHPMLSEEKGDLSVAAISLLWFVGPALVVMGLLSATAHPLAALAAVPGLVLLGVWGRSTMAIRRWRRGR